MTSPGVNSVVYLLTIKIRLVGIDAPETAKGKRKPGQPYSQKAKKYLAGMVLNKVVDVKGHGLGPYGRVLGVITSEGRNVNLEMIKIGLAEVYRGTAPRRFPLLSYWQAEKEAHDDKRGMWSQGDRYISPKDGGSHTEGDNGRRNSKASMGIENDQ